MNTPTKTRENLIKQILALLSQQISLLMTKLRNRTVYETAVTYLGVDASPNDLALDELGCAESVTNILRHHVTMPIILGTWTLEEYLKQSKSFKQVSIPMPGNIIISATGTSRKRPVPFVGHVGIVGERKMVMANDSYTGKWSTAYTIETWHNRYGKQGGYPVRYYALT